MGWMFCPLPPQEFMDAVAGTSTTAEMHIAVGKHVHDMVAERCRIRPGDVILDIGSGCGRVASQFMGEVAGEYHGLDIVLPMVEWCRTNISARDGHFHFHHADLSNTLYKGGSANAACYVFPFANDTFDAIFAASVFTHLLPASAHQYARELYRVLRPGRRALLTFYLVNDEWRRRIRDDPTIPTFPYQCDGCRTATLDNPEAVVAYEQDDAARMLHAAGLQIEEISLGRWSKNADGWTYQDAILAVK
jgi:SAM-dependent methyltransferase